MRKITKKVFAAVLALSLFAGFSTSVASFAATEEFTIPENQEYYIDSFSLDPPNRFKPFNSYCIVYRDGYEENNCVFSGYLYKNKFYINGIFTHGSTIKIPETFFGKQVDLDNKLTFLNNNPIKIDKTFIIPNRLSEFFDKFIDSFNLSRDRNLINIYAVIYY